MPGRKAGSRNRNYPALRLGDALALPRAIQDKASGTAVSRLTLAELLDVSPASSKLRELIAASRFYGLSNGGINADEFSLMPIGDRATGGDEVAEADALKKAVLNVAPYEKFLTSFNGKKVPSPTVIREFLVKQAEVDESQATECMENLLADAETAGFLRATKGGNYIEFSGTPAATSTSGGDENDGGGNEDDDAGYKFEDRLDFEGDEQPDDLGGLSQRQSAPAQPTTFRTNGQPKKVFIAHGKNRTPLDQLKEALDAFKVSYAVAVDEPMKGRPISKKVAALMREECSSGIFIFTADEKFLREIPDERDDDGRPKLEEVWRPSENVVFELGAASILYENRIVIFKEESVVFPSDYSDLGYIEFKKDQLVAELGNLFKELVGLDILEVRAKG